MLRTLGSKDLVGRTSIARGAPARARARLPRSAAGDSAHDEALQTLQSLWTLDLTASSSADTGCRLPPRSLSSPVTGTGSALRLPRPNTSFPVQVRGNVPDGSCPHLHSGKAGQARLLPSHPRWPRALLRQGEGRQRLAGRRGWRALGSPHVSFSSASWIRHPTAGSFSRLRGGTCLAVLDFSGRIARCSK